MWKTPEFWIAVAVAILIKIRTSARMSPVLVVYSVMVSLGAAYVGADWASDLTGAPLAIAAALVALTAEGIMRWVLKVTDDPKEMMALWKLWRGQGKD